MSEPTLETAVELGLLPEEFEQIKAYMGRVPNFTELSIYSVMWSEHCSYKNSITQLKTLPKESEHMLAEAGEENAGLVDIGEGLACCFKIESHNHPSAIEPYQGAATGVGGINRDIFSMGARPIAQLNSLRFGNINTDRTKWLVKGVTKGIGDYGNAFGIPTVGGEVYFDDCYETNILVNAMSVGIAEIGKTASASADGPGNPVYIFGSATGKDGIHGAAFASKDIGENAADDLPSVQVGDPFWEKLILEASLEILDTGAVIGMQDMGAAGITCSTAEMSAKSKTGMDIHLDKAPLRELGMKSWEILLSESQERMLVVLKKGEEKQVEEILEKWDLTWAQIGNITDTGNVRFYMHGELEADIPADSLVLGGGAPVYKRESEEPAYFAEANKFDSNTIMVPSDLREVAMSLSAEPNIASKKWVYNQYDSMVGTVNQSTNRPSDAAIVKVKGTEKSIAVTVDCNSRYVHAHPHKGTAIAVSEAARNIVCSGGVPMAITNCLNFGNPYDKGVYWQFENAIAGMREACLKFNTPVTGGNVSFYNQSGDGTSVYPTPTIGMIGLIEDKRTITGLDFKKEGDAILLLGKQTADINSSQYLSKYHKVALSPCPHFDIEDEFNLQEALKECIQKEVVSSCHDISEGGIFINLLESAMASKMGFTLSSTEGSENNLIRKDAFLFGEGQSRAIITIDADHVTAIENICKKHSVEILQIGSVKESGIEVDKNNWGSVDDFANAYENSIGDTIES